MIKIANELIKRGYTCDHKPISSISNCINKYYKDGFEVVLGLQEVGVPPTLITPMPYFVVVGVDNDGNKLVTSDCGMDIFNYLCKTDVKQIVDEIEGGKIIIL